ncbi:Oligosaccharide biosynthesis protein [Macrophomina phaseolina MS6]|uniref:UDP-N-acetylglucosamine transferase subunit ALG14 n=1 Tax=Macrophomina phaseolina (strain MS6) TaxID=1126212 RepID=K2SFT2_MACPH|nr:Oligosaccharide biosynthesis protein [Macrophomina phaseolina MS6]
MSTAPKGKDSAATPQLLASDQGEAAERDDEDDAAALNASPTRLLVVLGSGGHTAEMLAMLRKLDPHTFLRSWSSRTYVISEGDALSAERAREFEEHLLLSTTTPKSANSTAQIDQEEERAQQAKDTAAIDAGSYDVHVVPRARRIHQSLLTTPLSALRCLLACISILSRPAPPDLILTNGPGTGVIVVLTALVLRFVDVGDGRRTSRVRTVYVESWARVRGLSLSGRLLLRVVDRSMFEENSGYQLQGNVSEVQESALIHQMINKMFEFERNLMIVMETAK